MTDEELLDQYVNGNLDTVQTALESLEPIEAAATAVNLLMGLLKLDVGDDPISAASLFARRLNLWSKP